MIFCQKTGKTYAEAVWHSQTDCGMLEHWAPFLISPIALVVALNREIDSAEMVGVGIAHQVNATGEANEMSE